MSLQLHDLPPPGERLRALVASAKPVTLRRPLLQLAIVLACATAVGCLAVFGAHLRADHAALPELPFVVAAALWALTLLVGAALALLPDSRQVLPSFDRSRTALVLVLGASLVAGVLLAADSDASLHLAGMHAVRGAVHCARFGLVVALPIFAAGWWLVLRRIPVGGAIVGAALGASAGALSGLVLHLVCPIGGATHSLLGHVSVVVLGAVLGALTARR